MPAIKSEFRKLMTLRSTYYLLGFTLLLVIFFAFFTEGVRGVGENGPNKLASEVIGAVSVVSSIGAIIGLLSVTQEYRYNTISYTLTLARSRTQVLIAKIVTISVFTLIFTLIMGSLSPVLAYLGLKIGHHSLAAQDFPYVSLLLRSLFVGWGYGMIGLIIGFIVRAQVGAFVTFFLVPSTVEPLLGLLLKTRSSYLPFAAMQNVMQSASEHSLSHARGALVGGIYIAVGLIISWQLFLRRDAN